ncbi:FecR family protein [Gluconacetobacter sp. Hr-1-5]|uniref:FecR family protein n=1 Tax=Gluconacetobacter sp. Hr-1-5 TaxID=3395370 RepID=UPI003B519F39
MATQPDPIRERALKEATDWLILLQEEPDDPATWHRFQAWRVTSDANDEAWRRTEKTTEIVARLPVGNTGNWQRRPRAVGPAEPALPATRHWPRRRWVMAGVTGLAAGIALMLGAPDIALRLRADQITGTGRIATIHLPDGGSITLGPASALAFDGDKRHVILLAGEALFSVTHDERHPFLVTAGAYQTEDVGTVFDVRRDGQNVAVAVKSGRVHVRGGSLPAAGQDLSEGQALGAGAATFRTSVPPDQIGAWADGLLVANDEPLGEVVARLRPWLRGKIVVSSQLAQPPVSGVYNMGDPAAALDAIAHARQARVRWIGPWLALVL